jgi:hypothetical protein
MAAACNRASLNSRHFFTSLGCFSIVLAQIGRESANALANGPFLDGQHPVKLALNALGGAAAEVAFATLGAPNLAGAGHLKALGRALMGLELILLGLSLRRRHVLISSIDQKNNNVHFAQTCGKAAVCRLFFY